MIRTDPPFHPVLVQLSARADFPAGPERKEVRIEVPPSGYWAFRLDGVYFQPERVVTHARSKHAGKGCRHRRDQRRAAQKNRVLLHGIRCGNYELFALHAAHADLAYHPKILLHSNAVRRDGDFTHFLCLDLERTGSWGPRTLHIQLVGEALQDE